MVYALRVTLIDIAPMWRDDDACKHYAAKWTPATISSPTVLPLESHLESVASCQSGPHVTNTPQFKKDSVQSIIGVGMKLFFSSEKEESYTPLPYKVAHEKNMYHGLELE